MCNLAARPTGKGENSGNWHQGNQLPWEEHSPSGPAQRQGWSPVSFTLSSSAPVCVQDSCLNSAFSDNIRSTPPTSLLVHTRRLSVWMWFLQLKTPAWYPATGQSCSVTALGAGRTLVLYTEMHRSFHSLLTVIKPMIKNPTFASVEQL